MTNSNFFSSLKALLMVIIAAVTLAATSLVQNYFSQKGIHEEAAKRAQSQLESTQGRIMDVIDQAEAAVRNSVWIAQWCLNFPDSLGRVAWRVVNDNPVVAGSTVAVVPGYLPHRPLYSPYVFRNESDSLIRRSLATEEYDYPSQEWFTKPIQLDEGYWAEPYVDVGGGDMLMTTYSLPIKDKKENIAAVLTADISLDWLTELIGNIKLYPHASCTLRSRGGNVLVHTGHDEDLEDDNLIFESTVERTGWQISIVIPEDEVFSALRRIRRVVSLMQLIGIAMLILMLRSFIRSQMKYRDLDKRRERIEGELHIASSIQMSMVPKMFPPFPERHDLDMAATIVPAKEVGGDLYDFFIRDEKLFFCIGDVSGKGVPASLVMAVTRTTFRNLSANENSPGRIVTSMNESLSSMNENNMFVTFFCGVLDLAGGKLKYCNAGHNPPRILTDAISELPVLPNLPLGILQGMKFEEQEVPFCYDDALFLYTDGLTEAENREHEQFGEERMDAALRGRKSAQDHMMNITGKVTEFVGDAPQSDDLTILFIHYLPSDDHITLHNEISQISLLPPFVEKSVKESGINPEVAGGINLALEEAVTNVIMYAYPEGTDGTIDISTSHSANALTFTIMDKGKAFDPTAKAEVDTTAGVEERPIGGLGIHLVRTIMDDVRYERSDGKNILILTKNI